MFCRTISWVICIFVAAAVASYTNGPDYITEPSTTEPAQAFKKTTAVNLFGLLYGGNRAMVKLVAGDTQLVAHRRILAARSPVFAAMFRNGSSQFTFPDVEGPVLRQLLVYCYTLKAPQLRSMAPQLLAAAHKYGLPDLKAMCERELAEQLSVENAAATAALAVEHSSDDLTRAAIDFIKAHFPAVMATPGWADMSRNQPQVFAKVIQLLLESTAPNSTPPTASTTPPTGSQGQTAPATPPGSTYPPGGAAVTSTRAPTTTESTTMATTTTTTTTMPTTTTTTTPAPTTTPTTTTTTTTTTTARPSTDHGQTPTSAATPTTLQPTPTPDYAVVAFLRRLSEVEKGRRLIKAAKKNAVDEVTMLLMAGADLEARDGWKETALHKAARNGRVLTAALLLKKGAQVDARNRWLETPLHVAAEKGQLAVARLLLASHANPNAINKWGRTPLHYAANSDEVEVAEALLDSGANKGAVDADGVTPLDLTIKSNKELIDMLT